MVSSSFSIYCVLALVGCNCTIIVISRRCAQSAECKDIAVHVAAEGTLFVFDLSFYPKDKLQKEKQYSLLIKAPPALKVNCLSFDRDSFLFSFKDSRDFFSNEGSFYTSSPSPQQKETQSPPKISSPQIPRKFFPEEETKEPV